MDIIEILNDWWKNGGISTEKAKNYKRKIFKNIKDVFSSYKQILILSGLRRVGKTTIIFQLIEDLLKNGTDPRSIFYFSFDEKTEEPVKIMEEYLKITRFDWRKEKCFIFFDEIQKLENWSSKIKILYDNFPNLRICISGSASLMLEKSAIQDLAGRYFSEYVHPLTLQEFAELLLKKDIDNFELYESELKMIFDDYVRRPFPEIVEWQDKVKVNQYLRELVVEKVLKSDVPGTFKNVNISLLSLLNGIFMKDAGMILDVTALSRELGVHKTTLSQHIEFLEFSNLITVVKNFRASIRAESRKLKKVYPFNVALSLCYYNELKEGSIFESLVCSSLKLKRYWREGDKEIDFIKSNDMDGILPVEVKAKDYML